MSHTEGKLRSDVDWISDSDGKTICYVDAKGEDENEANARRLVACWNEHDGLVSDNAKLYESLNGEMRARLAVEKERDELVEALRDLYMHGFSINMSDRVSDILAKYPKVES